MKIEFGMKLGEHTRITFKLQFSPTFASNIVSSCDNLPLALCKPLLVTSGSDSKRQELVSSPQAETRADEEVKFPKRLAVIY